MKGVDSMYKATATRKAENDSISFNYDGTESNFWKQVGQILYDSAIPNVITLDSEHGTCELNVAKRGTYVENGVRYPSMFVTDRRNYISGLVPSHYEKAYLTCIHPESNNYKAYILRPEANGIYADYGSIDEVSKGNYRTVSTPYPTYLYWVRYYEKLSKGYKDNSDVLLGDTTKVSEHKNVAKGLYALLLSYAKHMVETTLTYNVTKKQVEKCKEILAKLQKSNSVTDFNKCLCELMQISPRKRNPLQDHVSNFMANDKDDFARILDFEESLVNAMDVVSDDKDTDENEVTFKTFGIDVREATDDEIEIVKGQVNPELCSKIKRVWKVEPKEQKKRFDSYCKKNKIKNIKLLWHGSRNENWASIIRQGLLLHPNAVITGKMFGNGIYFAPSARKSYGYTSCCGSYWARGNSNLGFMGLYATAYGKPYYPVRSGDMKPYMESEHKNCVHATTRNTGLYNDEIVFYNESAMCLEYFVEFSA